MNYIVVVRGRLKAAQAEARKVHDATVGKISPQSRQMGSTGHHAYLNPQDAKDFLAVDSWNNIEAIQKLYSDPALAAEFGKLFEGQPDVSIWAESDWMSY
ncbi:MAG TPA: hypothetical protein VLD63_05125 [Anaerolineales bacterium]|nr:hypothetical protein [Anaerolineales bacterium]